MTLRETYQSNDNVPHQIKGGEILISRISVFDSNKKFKYDLYEKMYVWELKIMGAPGDVEVHIIDAETSDGRKMAKGYNTIVSEKTLLSRARVLHESLETAEEYKKGGELDADSPVVKDYFAHKSGSEGGVLVGKRHSEGGIPVKVKSTGQDIEVEGGELILTRGVAQDNTKYEYEGKQMTAREIASDLNVKGGGVSFADGGDVPDKIKCACQSFKVGGQACHPREFFDRAGKDARLQAGIAKERKDHYETLAMLNAGTITIDRALRQIAEKEMEIDPEYPRN